MIESDNFRYFSVKTCCGCVLESPRRGDSNTHPQHMILWRTDGILVKKHNYNAVNCENFISTETSCNVSEFKVYHTCMLAE